MAFDFPASPTEGQTYAPAGGPVYTYTAPCWRVSTPLAVRIDARRNRIVNGAMQISQENGNTAGTTGGYYGADQWTTSFSTTATLTTQRTQIYSAKGSLHRYRVTVTVADASLAAGDYFTILQQIEGEQISDFMYGWPPAQKSILRFGWRSPAGTYSIALRNGGSPLRSYVANFTITAGQANTDTEQTFVIPGDTTGNWLTDTGIGVALIVCMAAGSSLQGTVGVWQAGNFFGTASNTNGMATAGAIFELFDVGLYLDPDATSLAPKWELPDYGAELLRCQRYYYKDAVATQTLVPYFNDIQHRRLSAYLPAPMRIVPASSGTLTNGGAGPFFQGRVTWVDVYSGSGVAAAAACSMATLVANARM